MCFPIQCPAPSLPETGGAVIEAGTCAADGSIGDRCRLGCKVGYDESNVVEGRCEARWLEREEVAVAEYVGQDVTCLPARNPDGSMAKSYCRMERAEAILDCCDQEAQGQQQVPEQTGCSTTRPPQTCSLGCAERWLPLLEDCEPFLAEFQPLSEACEAKAGEFLGKAPSTVTVVAPAIL